MWPNYLIAIDFCSNMIFVTTCSSLSRAFIIELILEFWISSRLDIWDNHSRPLRPNKDQNLTFLIQNGTIQSDKTKFSRDEIEKWHAGFMRDCPTGKENGFENILDPITSNISSLKWKIVIRRKLQRSEFVEIYNKFFPHGNATKFSQFVFDVFEKV